MTRGEFGRLAGQFCSLTLGKRLQSNDNRGSENDFETREAVDGARLRYDVHCAAACKFGISLKLCGKICLLLSNRLCSPCYSASC